MRWNVYGLVALGLVLAAGVGGTLGLVALDAPGELAGGFLGIASGFVGGLLGPQVPVKRKTD